jgi:outer membrane protein assembly factor BamB
MRRAPAIVLCLIAAQPVSSASATSSTPVPFPVVNGSVQALLVDGNTTYVGGHFTSLGALTGPLAFVGPRDGRLRRGFPSIAGFSNDMVFHERAGVGAVLPDGQGGLYVGGHFGRVAGLERSAVVRLRPDGSVDPAFRVDFEGSVHALELAGDELWVGGLLAVRGSDSFGLAIVDARTGARSATAPPVESMVYALERAGTRMYVSDFGKDLQALDVATAQPLRWATEYGIRPTRIQARGDKVYVAAGNGIEISAADGRFLREFSTHSAGDVEDPAIAGSVLVLGGDTDADTGRGLYAFDLRTGAPLPLFSTVTGPISALALHGGLLCASGVWRVSGRAHFGLVAFDLKTGKVRWTMSAEPVVHQVLFDRGHLVVAGEMRTLGTAVKRENLAAIDLRTGRIKPFAPRFAGGSRTPFITPYVSALAKRGRDLFVGGDFVQVNGRRHASLTTLDAASGRMRHPVPTVIGQVNALAVAGSTRYVGGKFGRIGDTVRGYLGSIDLRSRRVTSWNPAPTCDVSALAVSGGLLHVGGCFSQIAGRAQGTALAAFDLETGALSPRFPGLEPRRDVLALASDGRGGIWYGGALGFVGSTSYSRGLGHLMANGQPAANVPEVAGDVKALALRDGVLYLAGGIVSVAGRPRDGLAAIRAGTGAVTAFDPRPGTGGAAALAALPRGGLLVGGAFENTEQRATSGLARFGR